MRIASMPAVLTVLFLFGCGTIRANEGPADETFNRRTRICLNGEWDFHGRAKESKIPDAGWVKTRVPGEWHYWQKPGGMRIPGKWVAGKAAWYRLNFVVPKCWDDGRIVNLDFEGINYQADVRLNGKKLGEHSGCLTPFSFDITKTARYGENNTLLVYVQNSDHAAETLKYTDGGSAVRVVQRSSGIHRDVFLSCHPKVFVEDVFVITSVRKQQIKIRTWIKNVDDKTHTVKLRQQVEKDSEEVIGIGEKEITLALGETKKIELVKDWENPELWGFGKWGKPVLYFLRTALCEKDKIIDRQFTRFGFREFWCQDGSFWLNGKKIFIVGDTSSLWYAEMQNREFLTVFLKAQRDANISLIRDHTFVCPDSYYDVADELGMMMQPEFCLTSTSLEEDDWKRYLDYEETVIKDCVKHLRNHPSIVMWSDDNEGSSSYFHVDVAKEHKRMHELIKRLDPTRPVDSNGNCWTFRSKEHGVDFQPDVFNVHPYGYPSYPVVKRQMIERGWDGKAPVYAGELYYWCSFKKLRADPAAAYHSFYKGIARPWYESIITYYRKGLAGCAPHTMRAHGYHGPLDRKTYVQGPWGGGDKARKIDIPWPSLSGPGVKNERLSYGFWWNWFDPEKPFYTPNVGHRAVGKAYREATGSDVGRLNPKRAPEVVVKVAKQGQPMPNAYVFLVPRDGQATNPAGVMTDKNGTAWFVLKEPGEYVAKCEYHGASGESEVNAVQGETYAAKPGYQHIQHVELDLK